MSFEDFMAGTVDARVSRGSFDHSTKTLAPLPLDATDAAKTGREAELKVVQSEIAAKFDADYLPCAAQMGGLFAQAQSCRTLGQMLPLRLFQAQGYMIGHLVTLCQAYQADADVLAKLGLQAFRLISNASRTTRYRRKRQSRTPSPPVCRGQAWNRKHSSPP